MKEGPVWDERASVSVTGLTGNHGRDELFRSVLQGLAFGTRQCLEITDEKAGGRGGAVRAVGKGASNPSLIRYKADISGRPYRVMKEKDAAPLGAMLLAGIGRGEDPAGLISRWVEVEGEVEPDSRFREEWEELYGLYSEIYFNLRDSEHRLFKLKKKIEKKI